MTVILASTSAARRAVLSGAGVAFDVLNAGVDEEAAKHDLLSRGAGPAAIAAALAERKAVATSQHRPGLVIGADQTLDLEGQLFDKVGTIADARARLQLLRGRTHHLHSALAVAENGAVVWRETVSARMTMRDVSDTFLETYLVAEGAAALGSVGCYRLEALGAQLFSAIEGDYFTILGLPLMGLLAFLRDRGEIEA